MIGSLNRFTPPLFPGAAFRPILSVKKVGETGMLIKLWSSYRAAVVTAEGLAWHHGERGVEMARSAAEGPHECRWASFQTALVARLAADRLDCIRSQDTAGRYDLAESWARRRGQMIR